jgi:hypothetical protein
MPKMDGLEATREYRRHEEQQNIGHTIIVGLSGTCIGILANAAANLFVAL